MTDRPTVDVVPTEDGSEHVVISSKRTHGSPVARSYPIEGATEHEKIKGVVEKIINDRHTGEFLP